MSARQDGAKGKARGTRPGSIRQVRVRLWWAIQEAAELLDTPDPDTKLKAISALSTACGAYGNLTKTHTLEAEVETLQKELHDLRATLSRPASARRRATSAPPN